MLKTQPGESEQITLPIRPPALEPSDESFLTIRFATASDTPWCEEAIRNRLGATGLPLPRENRQSRLSRLPAVDLVEADGAFTITAGALTAEAFACGGNDFLPAA